jgi:lambda repressor-like predicted transcriptional regulator
LREWLEGVDRIAREVWQTQGEMITPDFVRDVLLPEAMTLIGVRDGVIRSSVERAHRMRLENPSPAQNHLAREIRKLTGEVANRYEIEARELDYQKAPAAQKGGPQSQLDELGSIRGLIEDATKDTTLWLQADPSAEERAHVLGMQDRLAGLDRIIARQLEGRSSPEDGWQRSETARELLSLLEKARDVGGNIVGKDLAPLAGRLPQELPGSKVRPVSRSAAPPIALSRTGGWKSRQPKPAEVPANPPTNFPSDLWPKTCVILADAVKKFPDRRQQMLELCKHFISEMTPLYRGAVVDGTMKAADVLREGFGGMQDLLHSLLIHNGDGPRSGFGDLSNKAYQIYLEARNSEEWRKLTIAVANAQEVQGLFKVVANAEMEVFGQNFLTPANLAQGAESKSANVAVGNERQSFVQPILDKKGWSTNRLAVEAEVDFHTVNDYLNGRTRPNRSTRKQLADALDIAVDELPK